MIRKVNKSGPNTLTVSMPAKWTKRCRIDAGDEISVEEDGTRLIISKDRSQKAKTAELHFTGESGRYIRSHIGRLYRHGYTTINVTFENEILVHHIKNAADNLIGAEMMDLDKRKCTIRIFATDDLEKTIDKYLVKMFSTLKYMLRIIEDDMRDNSFTKKPTLTELRNNNWKVNDYIMRNLFLQNAPLEESLLLKVMLFCYEKIGTTLLEFYRLYLENSRKRIDVKRVSHVFNRLGKQIDWFTSVLSKNTPVTYKQEEEFRREIRNFHRHLLNKLHSDRAIDHAFLTTAYFASQMLDSTVSYICMYKEEFA